MAETTGSIVRGPGSRNRDDGKPFDPFGWEEEPPLEHFIESVFRMDDHDLRLFREEVEEAERRESILDEGVRIKSRWAMSPELSKLLDDPEVKREVVESMREAISRRMSNLEAEIITELRAQASPESDTRLGIAAPDDPGVCSEPIRTGRNVVIRDGIPTIRQGHKEIRHRLKP